MKKISLYSESLEFEAPLDLPSNKKSTTITTTTPKIHPITLVLILIQILTNNS